MDDRASPPTSPWLGSGFATELDARLAQYQTERTVRPSPPPAAQQRPYSTAASPHTATRLLSPQGLRG